MLPGSRAWDESHSRSSPRASAELYTLRQRRKEKFRKRGDQPRNVAAENTQEETEARRGRRVNRRCEPHSTGLRRPPRFQTMSFLEHRAVRRVLDSYVLG